MTLDRRVITVNYKMFGKRIKRGRRGTPVIARTARKNEMCVCLKRIRRIYVGVPIGVFRGKYGAARGRHFIARLSPTSS